MYSNTITLIILMKKKLIDYSQGHIN